MKINMGGGAKEVLDNLCHQLGGFWMKFDIEVLREGVQDGLTRMEMLFNKISYSNKYIWQGDESIFSPEHSVQYAVFLYYVSNSIYKAHGNIREADLVYYLNKIMHSCDWFYAINLPDSFYAEHPLGSVLGRAEYGSNFFIYQGTTVGGNRDSNGKICYPVIGNNVLMYSNSSILGNCKIGNNVILSSGAKVIDEDIPDYSIVFGNSPNLIIKRRTKKEMQYRLSCIWRE